MDCDYLLTSSLKSLMVCCIGERYNKKVGVVFLSMLMTPTSKFSHSILGSINLYWLNRFTYKLNNLLWLSLKKSITDFRKTLGLPYKNMMDNYLKSNILTIYPVSKFLFTQPNDWDSNTHITGFLSVPNSSRTNHFMEKVPAELEEWLGQGEKPIYIGFGSIPIPDPEKMMSIIMEILNTTSNRIVFCIGWSVDWSFVCLLVCFCFVLVGLLIGRLFVCLFACVFFVLFCYVCVLCLFVCLFV